MRYVISAIGLGLQKLVTMQKGIRHDISNDAENGIAEVENNAVRASSYIPYPVA